MSSVATDVFFPKGSSVNIIEDVSTGFTALSGYALINSSKVLIADESLCFQVLLRPDVSEDSILGLAEVFLLSMCGQTSRKAEFTYTEPLGIANSNTSTENQNFYTCSILEWKMASNQNSSSSVSSNGSGSNVNAIWAVIRVLVGVNMDLQRCLLLYIEPHHSAKGARGSISGKNKLFVSFANGLITQLCSAMEQEQLLWEQLVHRCSIVRAAPSTEGRPMLPLPGRVSTVIDIKFICDLQAASAQHMVRPVLSSARTHAVPVALLEYIISILHWVPT